MVNTNEVKLVNSIENSILGLEPDTANIPIQLIGDDILPIPILAHIIGILPVPLIDMPGMSMVGHRPNSNHPLCDILLVLGLLGVSQVFEVA